LWCNHLAALALNGQSLTLSEEYVAGYFAFQPDARLTPYQEIQAVPPGHFLRINSSTTTLTRHWTFSGRSPINYKTDTEYEEQFRFLFRQSVRRRLRTDRPILAELSGGLDSSSVVCMADDIVEKEGYPAVVDTFSSFDPSEPDEDDFPYFSRVEERRGATGTHAELRGIGDSFSLFYSRFVAIPLLGERLEMKVERQKTIRRGGYRVVLSGTGGDEFLGQTLDPRVQMADLLMQWKFGDLWNQLMAWSLPVRRPWIQLLFQSATWFAPTTLRTHITKSAKAEPWINNKFAREFRLAELLLDPPKGSRWLLPSVRERMQTVPSFGRQLTNVVPSSYDVRYPFLDQSLVEFLLSIPIGQLLRPNERRSLMRRAFADLLPLEVVQRRTKAGVGRCYALTLSKHWNELQELLKDPIIAKLGFVDIQRFRKSVTDMKNGHLSFTFVRVLRGLVLECWVRDLVKRNMLRITPAVQQGAVPRGQKECSVFGG
jgi:asparagine synthase (glutamine-hydrolysing)